MPHISSPTPIPPQPLSSYGKENVETSTGEVKENTWEKTKRVGKDWILGSVGKGLAIVGHKATLASSASGLHTVKAIIAGKAGVAAASTLAGSAAVTVVGLAALYRGVECCYNSWKPYVNEYVAPPINKYVTPFMENHVNPHINSCMDSLKSCIKSSPRLKYCADGLKSRIERLKPHMEKTCSRISNYVKPIVYPERTETFSQAISWIKKKIS